MIKVETDLKIFRKLEAAVSLEGNPSKQSCYIDIRKVNSFFLVNY